MTRDRLQEMKEMMRRENSEEEVEMLENESSTPLIVFCDNVRAIKLEIAELKVKVKNLKVLLNDNQQWTDDRMRQDLERKIEEEKLVIGTSANIIRNNLKKMKKTPIHDKKTSIIQRVRDIQIGSVLNELNEVLRDYLNCLTEQRERSVKILRQMIEVKGDDINDIDALLEEGKIAIFTNNLLIRDMEEKYKLREAEDKRNEILKIESTIIEIRNLFNELALIVDLQEEKIETVERLVDANLAKVESGKRKITSANKKRKKARYRKTVIALACGFIIIIVLILLTVI